MVHLILGKMKKSEVKVDSEWIQLTSMTFKVF